VIIALLAISMLSGCATTGIRPEGQTALEAAPESIRATALKIGLGELSEDVKELRPYLPILFSGIDQAYKDYEKSEDIIQAILTNATNAIIEAELERRVLAYYAKTYGISLEGSVNND
jgi:hypothetical protein